jgi:hypothetical protein
MALSVAVAAPVQTTVASIEIIPDVVIVPPIKPAPAFTDVTVPPLANASQEGIPPRESNACPAAPTGSFASEFVVFA